jgi:serine/threonine protein kinase
LKYGDFKIITQVGQGGYGQVYLAKKSDSKEICALKVLNKKLLLKLDEIRHILTERDILTAAKSPWLVNLLYSFQDPENVYLAMEFVPGGDYRTLLNNTRILSPRHTRFYISEMFAALEALHKLGYIHRDLKPENFLIDSSGHIKLTDFGLASGAISRERVDSMRIKLEAVKDLPVPYRSVTERQQMHRSMRRSDMNYANSIVGSPDYMALEVLQGKDYDYTIDYWSLGCMLFETLAGYPPFAGRSTDETYANLQQWKRALKRPQYEDGKFVFSDRTWDLIQRLITSPRYRFKSFQEIQNHIYFADVDWENLRESSPPFVPQLDSEADAGYFDDFSNESDMAKYKEVMEKRTQVENLAERGAPLPSRAFIGFTFKHSKGTNVMLDETKKNLRRHPNDNTFGTIF